MLFYQISDKYVSMRHKFIITIIVILTGAFTISFCTKPSSEEKMLALLQETKAKVSHHENGFSPEAQLAYLDSFIKVVPETEAGQLFRINHFKANVLLQLGRSEEALKILKRLERDTDPFYVASGIMRKVKDDMAITYLRIGEQTNCITNHSVEACILPIKNGGIHQNTRGSKGSVAMYKELLAHNPDDLEALWLLNIAYMTLGKYPEGVPEKLLLPDLNGWRPCYGGF
jgi:tetratricopeptide (TPR) repeat protein